jgi:hypothetical protein
MQKQVLNFTFGYQNIETKRISVFLCTLSSARACIQNKKKAGKSRRLIGSTLLTEFINTVLEDWGHGYADFLRFDSFSIQFLDILYTHLCKRVGSTLLFFVVTFP